MKLDHGILQIIEKNDIKDQQNLLEQLGDLSFHINQSTLSRHLRKLGIRKQNGAYRLVDASPTESLNPNLALEVIQAPPNLLVVKTLPGHANAVAYHLESQDIEGIAGTVAGNDTLLVALTSPDLLTNVKNFIVSFFRLEDDNN